MFNKQLIITYSVGLILILTRITILLTDRTYANLYDAIIRYRMWEKTENLDKVIKPTRRNAGVVGYWIASTFDDYTLCNQLEI